MEQGCRSMPHPAASGTEIAALPRRERLPMVVCDIVSFQAPSSSSEKKTRAAFAPRTFAFSSAVSGSSFMKESVFA